MTATEHLYFTLAQMIAKVLDFEKPRLHVDYLDEDSTRTFKDAVQMKKYCLKGALNIVMLEPLNAKSYRFLQTYVYSDKTVYTDVMRPKYDADKPVTFARYDSEYLCNILIIAKELGVTVTMKTQENKIMTLEFEDEYNTGLAFRFLLAPRVEQ